MGIKSAILELSLASGSAKHIQFTQIGYRYVACAGIIYLSYILERTEKWSKEQKL
jgi:hypothetical protein